MDMLRRLFSKISQVIGHFVQMGRINCGYLEYFQLNSQQIFCHCLSLAHDYPLINHYFYKNLTFSDIVKEYLFGFGI